MFPILIVLSTYTEAKPIEVKLSVKLLLGQGMVYGKK